MKLKEIVRSSLNEFLKEDYSNRSEEYAGAHRAPSKEENDPMYDVSNMFPDMYTNNALKYYGRYGLDDNLVINQIKSAHNKPDANIIIYRAIPLDKGMATINDGDWVTTSKLYAKHHGESNLNNKYKIISKTVKAKELFTDGNSIFEWGYNV